MPSISIAALGLGIAGAGIQAIGAIQQSQAAASAAKYQAKVAQNNAAYASEAGQTQAQQESLKNAEVLGRAEAAFGANNIDVNQKGSSALKVRESDRIIGNVDAATIENNALLKAYGYQQDATLDRAKATSDLEGGWFNAAGGLLENASSLGFKWNQSQGGSSNSGGSNDNSGNSGIADSPFSDVG